MLWAIQDLMKPALSVIDLIPDVHRTPALAALRKALQDGRFGAVRLSRDEQDLAFYDGRVALVSPIGARVLKALYDAGRIKLKKPPQRSLPKLEAYIATEAAFLQAAQQIIAQDEAKRDRISMIVKDPASATPDEISPLLIEKVIAAQLGYGALGRVEIAGITCHRELVEGGAVQGEGGSVDVAQPSGGGRVLCWWIDPAGQRQGDPE
jgi:hypothetical protein